MKQTARSMSGFAENLSFLLPMFFATVPDNPARIEQFASLSNSINHVIIANQSSAVWNQVRYFVITPDQSMDAALPRRLVRRRRASSRGHLHRTHPRQP